MCSHLGSRGATCGGDRCDIPARRSSTGELGRLHHEPVFTEALVDLGERVGEGKVGCGGDAGLREVAGDDGGR